MFQTNKLVDICLKDHREPNVEGDPARRITPSNGQFRHSIVQTISITKLTFAGFAALLSQNLDQGSSVLNADLIKLTKVVRNLSGDGF